MSGAVWLGIVLLCSALFLELVAPHRLTEGFQSMVPVLSEKPNYFSQFLMKRGDVGFNKEIKGYIQDERYFHDYADVQRFGVNQDYCRMVIPKEGEQKDMFFACALAGTTGGDSETLKYSTNTVAKGFKLSRDDYMRDIYKDGRSAYCRVLKALDGTYQPLCRRGQDSGFSERDENDPDPPENILKLLSFYDGCVMWLRFRDDILDYVNTARILRAGSITIDERPRPVGTEGLKFDGVTQFLRLGDSPDLTFGSVVKLRTVRAFSMWVYMDEFTNNAHFFDFGDGPGKNNVFLGILGKGDPQIGGGGELRPLICGGENTLPEGTSGATVVSEVTPQSFMYTTKANVDEFVDIDQSVDARILQPSAVVLPTPRGTSNKATLHYEVWEQRQRRMVVKINGVIPLRKWTHIAITAITNDATRPDIGVFVNGQQVFVQPSGFLPQATMTTHNYIGKSNWANDSSTYEMRDELFAGKLFDFRMYKSQLSQAKIYSMLKWGEGLLGISPVSSR